MSEESKRFMEWLHLEAACDGKSSREWKAAGSPDNEHYRAGASNQTLIIIDYIERHPGILA